MKFLILCALTLVLLSSLTFAIYDGNNAKPHQFKYMVRLAVKLRDNSRGSCGGSVIAPKWILTAAHCLPKNVESVDIYFDTIKRSSAPLIVTVSKDNLITHPQFQMSSMRNDIALIEVSFDNSNNAVMPITLPKKDSIYNEGENVIVSGWGRMGVTNVNTEDLQWANMQIMPTQRCIDMYGPHLVKESTNLCLKSEDNATICPGDSGGPAVRKTTSGEGELVGLTSFGNNMTCQHGSPGVLTRVNKYMDWISQKTGIAF